MLSEHISATEDRYLLEVKSFITRLFHAGPYSHGTDHHERVWRNSIEILSTLENSGSPVSGAQTEALFFGAWFHDTGLVYDKSESHGNRSKEVFIKYVADNRLNLAMQKEIERSIQQHDRKEVNYTGGPADTATILSVADDMDSFGTIGIYRYIDIYNHRGLELKDIPGKVLKNVAGRFNNLLSIYSPYPDLVAKQNERFKIISDFFRNEVNNIGAIGETGPVMEFISKSSKQSVENIIKNNQSANPDITQFISSLRREYIG